MTEPNEKPETVTSASVSETSVPTGLPWYQHIDTPYGHIYVCLFLIVWGMGYSWHDPAAGKSLMDNAIGALIMRMRA